MILASTLPPVSRRIPFGTCDQFMQQAVTVAGNHSGTGITFVGHDLWGATLEIMYTIRNADTICLVGQNPTCSSANGTTQIVLPTIVGPTSITSDQTFPATNGNDLYIGMPSGGIAANTSYQFEVANNAQGSSAFSARSSSSRFLRLLTYQIIRSCNY